MKVYIVTESRTSADIYDQAEDYTNIVAVYAKREDALGQIEILLGEIQAHFAGAGLDTEVSLPDGEDGGADITVTDNNGTFVSEFCLAIHAEEIYE